ncbi:CCR4-NOT transcription complex subunit 10-B-like isoform X1 [Mangifera indica]|uniref:CCR4-NOT transcription complex subunit 10-B-like isoform X1 n=1 Tax=Mangifera indica TaxID=29780 RepID=UPI001CFB49C9|nr:CCR4-NOT transcription complex subunit 10-B-like isoform X1 [Mangifera indica]
MDSWDSTQSTNANKSPDDDGVLSVSATLAKEAALYFQSRKFDECIDLLNQLLEKKPDDLKILHNIAIAEYCRDGCTDAKKLLDSLNNVKKRSEELAHSSGEHVENSSNLGNKAILASKGSDASGHQFSAANSGSFVYMDEFDASVAKLNIAVIWFHLHEYAKALSILEPLYQNIEPIEETTALQICLLLLDIALACHDASRSADVLIYLEKIFGVGCVSQGDSGSMALQQSANLLAKYSAVPAGSSVADGSNSDLAASVNASESPLTRTLSEETLEDDTVLALSTLEISGQNLVRPIGLSCVNDLSRTLLDKSISTVDLKLKLQLYKVRFLLLTRNLKQAKREVKHAMNIARGRDSSMALFLKSQLEFARGNHRKAIKLLLASSSRTEMAISSMFNNNLGCIYYQFSKCHVSSLFFSKALSNSASLRKDKPPKLLTFSQDKSLLITYNCGVQYLACGKPILAARCFQKASLVFYKRPLLWLRLAECCLMALEKGLTVAGCAPSDRSEVRVHVVGRGKWRHLLIEEGISNKGHVDSVEKHDLLFGSDAQPKLSLSLARQCLTNALHLLNFPDSNYSKFGLPHNSFVEGNEFSESASSKYSNHKSIPGIDSKIPVGLGQVTANGDAKEQKGGTTLEIIQNSVSCYEDICRREILMIKQALFANLAFVELELENPVKALFAARSLLELPDCSRIYIFLGHVYAAEALCLLSKPKEAAEHFLKYLSEGNNVDLPFSQEDCEQWRGQKTVDCEELNGGSVSVKNSSPEDCQDIILPKPEEARGTLYANIAALYAVQGELDRAHQFVTQALSLLPRNAEATMTAIYVDLMLGKSQEAIARLKQCSHVSFLSSGLQLSQSC